MPLEAPQADGSTLVFPLQATRFELSIAGPLATVLVEQRFQNPLAQAMDARYVFPLPPDAAVDGMKASFGAMEIVAQLKKRAEAIATYEAARSEGRAAALLERERDDLFVQQLANVLPHEEVTVTLTFTLPLRFQHGAYLLTLPLVAGQRFTGPDEAAAADASAPRVGKGAPNPHRIEVSGRAEGAQAIEAFTSPSHPEALGLSREGEVWAFALGGLAPDRDLVLRLAVAGGAAKPLALVQADARGGHGLALLVPPAEPQASEVLPQDFVFLMDTSGSQAGAAFAHQQEVIRLLLKALHPQDTFNVVDFADRAAKLAAKPWPAEPARVAAAIAYVDRLEANGGTDLRAGIQEILALPAAPGGRLRSFVLLTDGLVGADREVLADLRKGLKPGQRLHAFGVGSGINRFLLERMAELGRGACITLAEEGAWGFKPMATGDAAQAQAANALLVARFLARVRTPLLRDVAVRWEGPGEAELWPERPKDLLAGEPVVVAFRVDGAAEGRLILEGEQANGQRYQGELPIAFPAGGGPEAVAKAFGQARLSGLALRHFGALQEADRAEQEATALAYGLASEWTAFVATAHEVRVAPDGSKAFVEVPLANPRGTHGDDGLDLEEAETIDFMRGGGGMPKKRSFGAPPPPSGPPRMGGAPVGAPMPSLPAPAPISAGEGLLQGLAPPQRHLRLSQTGELESLAAQALREHLATWAGPWPEGEWTLSFRLKPEAPEGTRWELLHAREGKGLVGRVVQAIVAAPPPDLSGQPWLVALLAHLEAWAVPAWVLDHAALELSA